MPRVALEEAIHVRTFPPPPRGFDPVTASAKELFKHGFPARPENPKHLEQYKRLFGAMKGRFTYIEPKFQVNPNRRHGPVSSRKFGSSVNVKPAVGTGNEYSPIWSGSLAFPPTGEAFRWITGAWTVPNVNAPDDNRTYYCATWIGIDGDASVSSEDVCQAGVNMDATRNGDNVTLNCSAWCEWFPGPELGIPNFPVTFGDTVAITICTSGAGATEATIFFANITAGHGTSFILDAGQYSDGSQVSLVGDSAEWVVERPEVNGETALLANYAQLFFSGCDAVSYTADGTSSAVAGGGTEIHIDMLPFGANAPAGLLSRGELISDTVVECQFIATGNGS